MAKKKIQPSTLRLVGAFLFSVFLPLIIFVAAQLAAFLVLTPVIPALSDEALSLTVLETFLYAGLFEILALAMVWLVIKKKKLKLGWLGLSDWPKAKNMILVLPAAGVYIIAAVAAFTITEILLPSVNLDQQQVIGFEGANGGLEITMAFLALVILTPIAEEVLMRGIIFRNLNRYFSFGVAAIVSAVVFGFLHGQFNVFIDTFVLGLVLAWLVNKTDSLWPAIGLHSLKNLIAFLYLFVL